MKVNNQANERVSVHVRMRPFNEEEKTNYNTTPIDNFDTKNGIVGGKLNLVFLINNYSKIFILKF